MVCRWALDSQLLNQFIYSMEKQEPIYDIASTRTPGSPSLISLAEEASQSLPCIIVIHQRSYGEGDGLLGDGQELEVLFHKKTQVICMRDTERDYITPVNSSFLFSVLYDPTDDVVMARKGYTFESVKDLMTAKPLPRAVYVGKDCPCSIANSGEKGEERSASSVLRKGQLLIIVGQLSEGRFGRTKTSLQCLAVDKNDGKTTINEVHLKEKCEGHFSTQESLVLFPLPLLLEHLETPIRTSVYEKTTQDLHPRFKNKCTSIQESPYPLSSFIISNPQSTTGELPNSSLGQLIEIYSSMACDFEITQTNVPQLKQKMNTIYQSLSPKSITAVVHDTGAGSRLQDDLLSPLNNDGWMGDIVIPPFVKVKGSIRKKKLPPPPPPELNSSTIPTVGKPSPLTAKPSLAQKRKKDLNQNGSQLLAKVLPSIPHQMPIKPQPTTQTIAEYCTIDDLHIEPQIDYTNPAYGVITPLQQGPEKSSYTNPAYGVIIPSQQGPEKSIVGNKNRLEVHSPTTPIALHLPPTTPHVPKTTIAPKCTSVDSSNSQQGNIHKRSIGSQTIITGTIPPDSHKEFKTEEKGPFFKSNKDTISDYNIDKVGGLLVRMNLSEYVTRFAKEMINGQLLLELDEEMIAVELGINKKLHCHRLLMIIDGKQSVADYT